MLLTFSLIVFTMPDTSQESNKQQIKKRRGLYSKGWNLSLYFHLYDGHSTKLNSALDVN